MVEDCIRADFCVTDGVSIIAYWAATGNPLAILRDTHSPDMSIQFEDINAAVDTIPVGTSGTLAAWLDAFALDPKRGLDFETQAQLIKGALNFFSGNREPGQLFSDWIKSRA